MSHFVTKIPVDIEAVKAKLPNGYFLEGKPTFDAETGEISLHWSHHRWVTPFTFETECPIETLDKRALPPQTRVVNFDKPQPVVQIPVDKKLQKKEKKA